MKPFTRSIIDLFDGKRRYLIPLYQRQYSWRENPQIALLREGIERAIARIEADRSSFIPYFMGAIVINRPSRHAWLLGRVRQGPRDISRSSFDPHQSL